MTLSINATRDDSRIRRITIRELREELERLTVKLLEYEAGGPRCVRIDCLSDGLRLSQEVELLRRQNAVLLGENEILRKRLAEREVLAAANESGDNP